MKQFFGIIFLIVGVLAVVLAGGCSLWFGEMGVEAFFGSLMFSGIPILLGVGLIILGRRLLRDP